MGMDILPSGVYLYANQFITILSLLYESDICPWAIYVLWLANSLINLRLPITTRDISGMFVMNDLCSFQCPAACKVLRAVLRSYYWELVFNWVQGFH